MPDRGASERRGVEIGITTIGDDTQMSPVRIDTSAATTDTIDYLTTDQNGLTSTSTRTVVIEAPSIVSDDEATTTDATTTTATSTSS